MRLILQWPTIQLRSTILVKRLKNLFQPFIDQLSQAQTTTIRSPASLLGFVNMRDLHGPILNALVRVARRILVFHPNTNHINPPKALPKFAERQPTNHPTDMSQRPAPTIRLIEEMTIESCCGGVASVYFPLESFNFEDELTIDQWAGSWR